MNREKTACSKMKFLYENFKEKSTFKVEISLKKQRGFWTKTTADEKQKNFNFETPYSIQKKMILYCEHMLMQIMEAILLKMMEEDPLLDTVLCLESV
jgi:hypothetical protein